MANILNMRGTLGGFFRIPLSNHLYQMVTKMIEKDRLNCVNIANDLLEKASKADIGSQFTNNLWTHPEIAGMNS